MKFIIRIFLSLTIIFSIIFTLFVGRIKIQESPSLGQTESYKGILTLWQIDSFEGGTGSRKQFLLKAARSFEKKNPGVLVMVIEHTEQSMQQEIAQEVYPDLISFGTGIEVTGFRELSLKSLNGGMIGDKTYAQPWCRGGYVLIANPKLTGDINDDLDSILVSQSEYTQPLTALYLDGITAENITVKKPMEAYVEFVTGKIPYFLGTQRDINRLERRQMEVITRPIKNYNDIYQYISITTKNAIKSVYSERFVEHLLCEEIQKSLNEIGMMSASINVEYYNQHLIDMQAINNFSTVSAFASSASLKEMQENSLLLLKGNKELEIKIKNMLV